VLLGALRPRVLRIVERHHRAVGKLDVHARLVRATRTAHHLTNDPAGGCEAGYEARCEAGYKAGCEVGHEANHTCTSLGLKRDSSRQNVTVVIWKQARIEEVLWDDDGVPNHVHTRFEYCAHLTPPLLGVEVGIDRALVGVNVSQSLQGGCGGRV
jgi:hypothetical protein